MLNLKKKMRVESLLHMCKQLGDEEPASHLSVPTVKSIFVDFMVKNIWFDILNMN